MDFKNFDTSYFDKLSNWIINKDEGAYKISMLTSDTIKFSEYVGYYNQCRPIGFNRAFLNFTTDEIIIRKIDEQ